MVDDATGGLGLGKDSTSGCLCEKTAYIFIPSTWEDRDPIEVDGGPVTRRDPSWPPWLSDDGRVKSPLWDRGCSPWMLRALADFVYVRKDADITGPGDQPADSGDRFRVFAPLIKSESGLSLTTADPIIRLCYRS